MSRIYLSISIFIAIILGFIFNIPSNFKICIPIILAILMLFNFLKIEYRLKHFLKFELLFPLFFTLLILPFILYFITKPLALSMRLGLFLILITPSAIASPIVTKLINGNTEFSVANMLIYNFIAPLSYPLLLKLYFNSSGISISVVTIFIKLILIIFLPFLIAIIISKFISVKKIILKFNVSNYLLVLLIFIIVSISSSKIKNSEFKSLFYIISFTAIIALVNYSIGFLIGKNLKMKKTIAVSLGQKNTGLCIMAIANFDIAIYPFIYLPTIIYIIFHHLISAILILFYSKKIKKNKKESKKQ